METLLARAMGFAVRAHDEQTWKGSTVPYITHAMEVCGIVSGMTENMEVRAAAVLHSVPGTKYYTTDGLYNYFGSYITDLLRQATEDPLEEEFKKTPRAETWEIRKERFIQKIESCHRRSVQRIILADKLSDLRALKMTVAKHGPGAWELFNQPDPVRQMWYYRSVLDRLVDVRDESKMAEARKLLRDIEYLSDV